MEEKGKEDQLPSGSDTSNEDSCKSYGPEGEKEEKEENEYPPESQNSTGRAEAGNGGSRDFP